MTYSLPSLRSANRELGKALAAVVIDKKNLGQVAGAIFASQIHETSYAILNLSRSRSASSIALLVRQLLELAVRLAYLSQDPSGRIKTLELTDLEERVKAMKELATETNIPFSAAYSNSRARMEALQLEGVKSVSIHDMMTVTKQISFYPVYRRLCAFAHGQIFALSNQFVSKDKDLNTVLKFQALSAEQKMYANDIAPSLVKMATRNLKALRMLDAGK
jgi:Family of unknown function (DUF5677)